MQGDDSASDRVMWTPTADQVARANLTAFIARVQRLGERTSGVVDFQSLYDWSVRDLELFWTEVWRFCGVISERRRDDSICERVLIGRDRVAPPDPERGPRWFVGTRLNFAENLLKFRDDREAIVFWNEEGAQRRLTYAELHAEVARIAAGLRELGVGIGDRVAGYLPNLPETIIAMLATASIGAIWSSCSPDFGVPAVLDRFGQIAPKVLVCADGYLYAGKAIDCLTRVAEVARRLPAIEHVIVVPYRSARPNVAAIRGAIDWRSVGQGTSPESLTFERLPFDHPLYIMYSSGTTGLPKCMIHGAGGTLLQHLKELVL